MLSLALHTVVSLIGITITSIFINKIINLDGFKMNKITEDFATPIVSLPVFAFSAFIYLVFPEITLLLALFVIPQVMYDFYKKFNEYDAELAQLPAFSRVAA